MSELRDRLAKSGKMLIKAGHLPANKESLTVRYCIGVDEFLVGVDRTGLFFPAPNSYRREDAQVICERPIFERLLGGDISFMDCLTHGEVKMTGDRQAVLFIAERNLLFEAVEHNSLSPFEVIEELLK